MTIDMVGTRDGEPWPAKGEEADLPTAAAAHLVAAGVAEQITEPSPAPTRKGGRRAAVSDS
ncbi:hypothetical protein [Streptomyces sp. NPDC060184]|uniref:hypothetical protein n=1 Tax=Streptomyces sp. NPDC060184 TaxID=3347064 RepID=UPI003650FA23